MNDVIDAIVKRRSIRKYKSEVPTDGLIAQVVEAGLYAASGLGRQDTKLVVIKDPEVMKEISRKNCEIGGWEEGFDPFYGAPVAILVLGLKDWRNTKYDGALVMGNLMLAAYSLGLGSCWINRALQQFDTDEGREFIRSLGIEGEWEGIGFCALGYPDEELPDPPKRKEDRVYYV